MGIAALGRRPRTSKPGARPQDLSLSPAQSDDREREPRLGLPTLPIFRSGRGFLYLVAIIDWASRAVLAWPAVEHDGRFVSVWWRSKRRWRSSASRRFSTPTKARSSLRPPSPDALAEAGIAISMDGRGRWMDNVFIEEGGSGGRSSTRGRLSQGLLPMASEAARAASLEWVKLST